MNRPNNSKKNGGSASQRGASNKSRSNASQGSGNKRKRSRNRKRQDPRKFWGQVEALPEAVYGLTPTEASDALVGSLGRPPIPGHETSAQHYFKLVYDRAVSLSFALASAGGLDKDAPEPLPTFAPPADSDDFDTEDDEEDEADDDGDEDLESDAA